MFPCWVLYVCKLCVSPACYVFLLPALCDLDYWRLLFCVLLHLLAPHSSNPWQNTRPTNSKWCSFTPLLFPFLESFLFPSPLVMEIAERAAALIQNRPGLRPAGRSTRRSPRARVRFSAPPRVRSRARPWTNWVGAHAWVLCSSVPFWAPGYGASAWVLGPYPLSRVHSSVDSSPWPESREGSSPWPKSRGSCCSHIQPREGSSSQVQPREGSCSCVQPRKGFCSPVWPREGHRSQVQPSFVSAPPERPPVQFFLGGGGIYLWGHI